MAKRRRNQSSTVVAGQPTAQPPAKKPKIDGGLPSDAPSTQPQKSGKSVVVSTELAHSAKETPPTVPTAQVATDSGLSKGALKRKRQRENARKLRKQSSKGDKSQIQGAQDGLKGEQGPQPGPKPAVTQQSQASKIQTSNSKPEVPVIAHKYPSASSEQPNKASKLAPKPKQPRSDAESKQKRSEHSKQPAPKSSEKPRDDAGNDVSKKTRRRQRAFQAKQGDPLQVSSSKRIQDENDQSTASASATFTKQASRTDPSLLLMATQTSLMPRPTKEWIDKDFTAYDKAPAQDDTADNINETTRSESKPAPTHAAQASLAKKRPSSSPESSLDSGSPKDADRSLAKIGLPPVHQAPATRPGINTIASFSLSSRRQNPTEILPSERKISGLSGMRMDTGGIGSYTKPMNSLKANSVPSYSGSSDVQAAFKRFQKFTNGGESSDSEDNSDDSESESENEVPTVSKAHNQASKNDVAAPEIKAAEGILKADSTTTITTPVGARDPRATQIDTLGQADKATENDTSSSDDSNASDEEDVEAADQSHVKVPDQADQEVAAGASQDPKTGHATLEDAQANNKTMPTQCRSNDPPMQDAKDLPLFSDFNARHSSHPADPAIERSNSFLGSDLGGNPSGPGPIDDHNPASQLAVDDDHLASQDLFRTIDDFSREVFGSTRELPDSKPLSKILETPSEPLVTDHLSSNGLSQKSIEEKTPDKAIALNHIARGSSPILYIVNSTEMTGDAILDLSDDSVSDDEEQGADNRPVSPPRHTRRYRCYGSSPSPLSSLTPSPPPEEVPEPEQVSLDHGNNDLNNELHDPTAEVRRLNDTPDNKKRKMTGTTSKHFSPQKSMPRRGLASKSEDIDEAALERHRLELDLEQPTPPHDLDEQFQPLEPKMTTKTKKGTGKTSQFFTPTTSPSKPSTAKTPRPPKGTSTCPVPSTKSAHFGLIQEKLWREPFWLLIAVTFLNKTAGRSAAPIFWELKALYPTPEALSQANVNHLISMIGSLGLQNQRAKRLVLIAKAWLENPPTGDKRYRTLHYPSKNDGKAHKKDAIIYAKNEDDEGEDNDDFVNGALEIGHIPGCGPYAWDSWRIFCRDVQRGLANDYNGQDADYEEFVPEWRRVLPLDKELRACLRWMWLRDGWVWDCETGDRRLATKEEMEMAAKGEMEIKDEQERKFAKVAAAAEDGSLVKGESNVEEKKDEAEAVPSKKGEGSRRVSIARRELDVESGESAVDEMMVVDEVVPARKGKGSSRMRRELDIESAGEGGSAKKGKGSRRTSIARRELDVGSGDEVVISTQRRSRRNRSAQ